MAMMHGDRCACPVVDAVPAYSSGICAARRRWRLSRFRSAADFGIGRPQVGQHPVTLFVTSSAGVTDFVTGRACVTLFVTGSGRGAFCAGWRFAAGAVAGHASRLQCFEPHSLHIGLSIGAP